MVIQPTVTTRTQTRNQFQSDYTLREIQFWITSFYLEHTNQFQSDYTLKEIQLWTHGPEDEAKEAAESAAATPGAAAVTVAPAAAAQKGTSTENKRSLKKMSTAQLKQVCKDEDVKCPTKETNTHFIKCLKTARLQGSARPLGKRGRHQRTQTYLANRDIWLPAVVGDACRDGTFKTY